MDIEVKEKALQMMTHRFVAWVRDCVVPFFEIRNTEKKIDLGEEIGKRLDLQYNFAP